MNICLYLSLSEKIQNEFEIVHPILVYKVNKDVCYTIIPKEFIINNNTHIHDECK